MSEQNYSSHSRREGARSSQNGDQPARRRKKSKKKKGGVMRVIGTLLLIFLTTSAFLACFAAVYIVNVILPQANMDLSSFNVDENSVMYYQDKSTGEYKELRQVLSVTNSQWVDYEDMPQYLKDAAGLNCKKPTVQPRATEHIQQILDIVKDLIDSGHAYVAKNGDVYFRVKSDPEYGKLSHLKLDDLESGNRELRSQMDDDLKEDPADFAVWKAAKPGEPAWESPYGMGRPGWHIECSAMSRTHLGKTIDLHCGGQDLIFPHHENEIAQSECANGCTFARYWMHNGFINVDNQKMSKSLHNFFTVRDVANLYGYEPIRYFMLTAGYRMPLNYTVDLIESCKNSLERLYTCRENLDFALSKNEFGTDETLTVKAEEARKKFCTAMDDDLNTPDALAAVFDLVKEINTLSAASSKKALEAAAAAFDEITGVLGLMYNRKKDEVPAEVTELVEQRAAAKKAKDWATADAIRARLTEMGWAVKDTAQGPQLSKL